MKASKFTIYIFAIAFTFIGLGCHTVKVRYAKMKEQKHPVKSNIIKPVRNATQAYILRFHKVAQTEQQKFGIPASITLAQGILESGVGRSKLASKHNNHFGIKCWCKGRQHDCVPMADDSPNDRFKRYPSAWQSYRHHSQFVSKMPLKVSRGANYKQWAKALKRAGYATKRTYAEDLIAVIEKYELHKYDL